MQMDVMALGAAIVVEAVAIAGLLIGMARLRGRVNGMDVRSAGVPDQRAQEAINQLNALVEEASALGETLASQCGEIMDRYAALSATAPQPSSALAMEDVSGQAAAADDAAAAHSTTRRRSTARAASEEPAGEEASDADPGAKRTARARATTAKKAAQEAEEVPAPTPAPVTVTGADAAAARQKGMDPLGVALQRSLAQQSRRRDTPRA